MYHFNRIKNKNFISILIDTEKAFDKMQQPFLIKTLDKLGIGRNFLNLIKASLSLSLSLSLSHTHTQSYIISDSAI